MSRIADFRIDLRMDEARADWKATPPRQLPKGIDKTGVVRAFKGYGGAAYLTLDKKDRGRTSDRWLLWVYDHPMPIRPEGYAIWDEIVVQSGTDDVLIQSSDANPGFLNALLRPDR